MDINSTGGIITAVIGGTFTIVVTIIGSVKYFFNVKDGLHKEISQIDKEYKERIRIIEKENSEKLHSLELKIKDLEYKDQQQQSILDTFPNVFAIVNKVLDKIDGENANK